MTGLAGSARAQALRRARAAAAVGEAERVQRQQKTEAALARYFEAAAVAARIRDTARARAAQVTAAAEQSAECYDEAACEAIAALRALGEVNGRIASMCGISVPAVRAMAFRGRLAASGGRSHDDRDAGAGVAPGREPGSGTGNAIRSGVSGEGTAGSVSGPRPRGGPG